MKRFAWLAALAVTMLFAVMPTGAWGRELVASEPRSHQQLSQRPSAVTLAFDADVDAGTAKLLVLDAKGVNRTINELIVEGTNITALLAYNLPRGTYTVHYRAYKTDGEPQGGAFQFAYGRGAWTKVQSRWKGEEREPAVLRDTDPKGNPIRPTSTAMPPEVEVSTSATAAPVTSSPSPRPTSAEPSVEATPTPTASPTPEPEPDSGSNLPLWAGLGVVTLAVAAGAMLLVRRRQS